VDGTLHLCLGAEARVELRARLRAGISDGELEATILRAIEFKPRRHDFSNPASRVIRVMAATGG
jgi:cyclic pyranopterin phosphate synthase